MQSSNGSHSRAAHHSDRKRSPSRFRLSALQILSLFLVSNDGIKYSAAVSSSRTGPLTTLPGANAADASFAPAHLPRRLGLVNAITTNTRTLAGTGPFITGPAILATMGGPQSLIAWGAGALLAICDGLVFAELGASFPQSGGSYNFLRECLGRQRWGHMMAWVFVWQFLFSGTLEIATSSIGIAEYAGFLWPKLVAFRFGVKLLAASVTGV